MSQKLLMPFKAQMMLCGYKNEEYQKYWGYPHYGVDISAHEINSDHNVLASGDGIVVAAARDNSLGCGIAILYKDCISRNGEKADLIARYMHLSAMKVSKHDVVKAGDILGLEGKEGTQDYHLHLEFDTDLIYPTYSPQVSNNHTFWMKGIDTTVNPSMWLFVGDNQEIAKPTYNPAWLNPEDFNIPKIKEETEMADIIKLPINEDVPLFIEKVVDGELDEVAAYGKPVWAYQKRPDLAYGYYTFDKYMRRVPCWWTDVEGEFATETEWENLVPISEVAQEYINPREGKLVPTDTKNYDYLFEIPEAPIESEKPIETVKPNEPVTPPTAYVCPFAENTAKIKELAEQILKLCGG